MNTSTRACLPLLGFFPGQPASRLYGWAVQILRALHYSHRTAEAHVHWNHRLTLFHAGAHSCGLGEVQVTSFLTHLAVKQSVVASPQNQALTADHRTGIRHRHYLNESIIQKGGAGGCPSGRQCQGRDNSEPSFIYIPAVGGWRGRSEQYRSFWGQGHRDQDGDISRGPDERKQ